ncbi:serine hydrolase [Aquimarina sp. 2201CG5-10]|uniref:serine hydrolase n=1 Tax=Aquimarina callyspongiae TaxID=3098150 RepID=UPI002AB3D470|nr:serine hydrolase [Aquimarina sp. 2201CG5-10]MDY8135276.1 serine hydrolase [Aquimarina sp. 2201CG5-10]
MKLITSLLLLVLTQTIFGQNKVQKIDSLFTNLYNNEEFNGNVLIAEKGTITYKKSFGNANEITNEKLTEESIFELASCTKPFTAMAIVILKERGLLNLDDKITKFFPELSKYNNVTIRNLLNHTGGLPDYMSLMFSIWDKTKIATNKDVIKILKTNQSDVRFEPNSKTEYSNTGYVLLASIIEKASGQSYPDFLKSAIFEPLQMSNTFVYHRRLSPQKIKNYALGYLYINDEYILPDDFDRSKFVIWLDGIEGDGTVNSTILDLYKWDRALYNNQLVSEKSLEEVFSNGVLDNGSTAKYGLGWRVLETTPFGKIARHSGGWPGYLTYIERDIDNDKTIIILQNHQNGSMPKQAVRNILYGMPLPKTMKNLYSEGKTVDQIITLLEDPVSKYLIDNFYERNVNRFGYQLMEKGKVNDALKIFRYNTVNYPASSNAFDSLGECLLQMKNTQQAQQAYKKALELDPTNKNAASALAKIHESK